MKNSAFKPRTLNIQVNISLRFYFLFQITKLLQEKLKDNEEKNNHLEKKKKWSSGLKQLGLLCAKLVGDF